MANFKVVIRPSQVKQDGNMNIKIRDIHNRRVGYLDHIVPLSKGGTDVPSNMQLISTEQHIRKTAHDSGIIGQTDQQSVSNLFYQGLS